MYNIKVYYSTHIIQAFVELEESRVILSYVTKNRTAVPITIKERANYDIKIDEM